jgi:hypothetical protein
MADERAVDRFRRIVLDDPEFKKLRARAMKSDPAFDTFYMHLDNHLWPLKVREPIEPPEWADDNTEEGRRWRELLDQRDRSPPDYADTKAALARQDALLTEFFEPMRSGSYQARGITVHAGDPADIQAGVWSLEDCFFHDGTGDIHDAAAGLSESGQPARRWRAVELHRADLTVVMAEPAADRAVSRSRPVAEEVAKLLRAEDLHDDRGGRTYKEIAGKIAGKMSRPPNSQEGMYALTKAVTRHYKDLPQSRPAALRPDRERLRRVT